MYEAVNWLYLNLADADVNSFLPAWAAYRGLITTPNIALPAESRKTHLGLTPHLVRLFRNRDVIALEKELAVEGIRRLHFPASVSRLSCIYCWPDEATARLAPSFWSNQGRHFHESYLVRIGITSNRRPTIVDTRWIDKYMINSKAPLSEIGIDWIYKYWSGAPYPWDGDIDVPKDPLNECLVDGTALIYGTELRMEAYSLIERIAPDATGILEKGRLGVDICTRFGGTDEWRLGQIVPVLLANEEKTAICIKHLIHIDDALAGSINEKVSSSGIAPNEINHSALEVFKKDTLRLPDLRELDVDASWLKQYPALNECVNITFTAFFLENGGSVEAITKNRQA